MLKVKVNYDCLTNQTEGFTTLSNCLVLQLAGSSRLKRYSSRSFSFLACVRAALPIDSQGLWCGVLRFLAVDKPRLKESALKAVVGIMLVIWSYVK